MALHVQVSLALSSQVTVGEEEEGGGQGHARSDRSLL